MESSSTSSSSQHYATLLATVAELRSDLERTVTKMHSLESENSILQSSYGRLKDELTEMRNKYVECRENYMITVTEKLEAESQYQSFMERVKAQLIERTNEFEQLRDKFAPQDIDAVRIKVQEELEIPHQQKIQQMQVEVDLHRDQYFAMRRDLERCKAEYEAYSENQRREVIAIREEHESVICSLRDEISKLQDREYMPEKDEQIRSQKLKLHELQIMVEAVREEIKVVRNERDVALFSVEELRCKSEEALSRLKLRSAQAEADKLAMEQKMSVFQLDNDRKESLSRILKQSVDDLTAELEHLRKQVHEVESRLSETVDDNNRLFADARNQFEADKRELQVLNDTLTDRLNDREEVLRRAQREASEMQIKAESVESELRRCYQLQLQDVASKASALEVELADACNVARSAESQKQKLQDHLESELGASQAELSRLKREKDVLHSRTRELETKVDEERRKSVLSRREVSVKISSLQEALKASKVKMDETETELFQSQRNEKELRAELRALQNQAVKQGTDHAHLAESLQDELNRRVASVEAHCRDALETAKRKCKAAIVQEKKRADAYKAKALEAHRRGKAISEAAIQAAILGGEADSAGGVGGAMYQAALSRAGLTSA